MEVQADVCQRSTGPNGQCRVGRLLADHGGDAGSETDDSAQLSPGFQPKCFDGLVREEPTSVKVCQHQLDEQQLGKSTEAEKDFAVAENSLREAEKAIGNEKIAAYYHELLTRIVAPHATHLGACKVPIKAQLRQRASRAEEEWRVRPGSVLFGVDRRRPLAHG